ncbi:RNA-binding protein with multiple splicing [Plakobranchus ocellatus]|uniref:RNA-binding protein with multiple splicing n=1 Tax=Plakobranchus ocellatus TaxID=259542 RepID=A0AAV4CFZ0_9GAST|nr:RNA-binding protein with multiple splicing [Plakobranchus ocellatus]
MEESSSTCGDNPLDMDPALHENFLALIAQHEQVRTLFVSGLPMDAKPRELYLLFRAYKSSVPRSNQEDHKIIANILLVEFV